jgi:hypothetical protein
LHEFSSLIDLQRNLRQPRLIAEVQIAITDTHCSKAQFSENPALERSGPAAAGAFYKLFLKGQVDCRQALQAVVSGRMHLADLHCVHQPHL